MINPAALRPLLVGNSAEHFKAAARGVVAVMHCKDCGHHWFPAGHVCPKCLSEKLEWVPVSGRATLWSWCEFHKAYFKGLRERVPYVVVLARLDEGPKLFGNLIDGVPAELSIGMRLEAVAAPAGDEAGLVNFRAVRP